MARNREPFNEETRERVRDARCVADVQKILEGIKTERLATDGGEEEERIPKKVKKEGSSKQTPAATKKSAKKAPLPRVQAKFEEEEEEEDDLSMPDLSEDEKPDRHVVARKTVSARPNGRARGQRKSYVEPDGLTEEE